MDRIKIGISSCLLGEKVRYDGGHKHDRFLTETLGNYVEYVPVCPEVDCGLSVPREAMRLVGDPAAPRLLTIKTQRDYTDQMQRWARNKVIELEKEDLCGFIFKSKSPSSGMERVKVYDQKGMPSKNGVGIFARVFMEHFPLIPVEEEGRLYDPVLRMSFIEKIFVLQRWRQLAAKRHDLAGLMAFHSQHKSLFMAHSEKHMRLLGKLAASGSELPIKHLYSRYEEIMMEALKLKTSNKKNANVLMHMLGYFKKQLIADEKQECLEIIYQYKAGHIPLIVPITLINHYVRKYNQPYLREQIYLNPHPIELHLRNHV